MNRAQSKTSFRNKKMQQRRKRRRMILLQRKKECIQERLDNILSTPTLQKEITRAIDETVVSNPCDSDFEILVKPQDSGMCVIC